jgi:replicative DNA helicase
MTSPRALSEVLPRLKAEDFYSEAHRLIYRAIQTAAQEHKEIDHLAVAGVLRGSEDFDRVEGRALIFNIIEGVPVSSGAIQWCAAIKRASRARAVLDAADRIKERCLSWDYEDAPQFALAAMEEIAREETDRGASTYADVLDEFAALIGSRRANEGVTGIRTGLSKMDRALGGLNPGISYIIAARPGIGKSLVISQISQTAANQGYRVLIQTPEMSKLQYLDRLAHAMAHVDYEEAQEGIMSDEEEERVNGCAAIIAKLPVYIDDHGTQTPSRIRANVLRYKPDLLLVDYLQYVSPDVPNPSRNQEVGAISRALTRIKSDFHIPVVLAAQLNREVEKRHDKRPTLADLRDSGEIEQDADAVMFLHKPGKWDESKPDDELEIHCEKWRFGSLWETTLYLKTEPKENWLINRRGEVA